MNEMNYRYNNPNANISVDEKITAAFLSKPRTSRQIEDFGLWASMSSEAKKLAALLLQMSQTKEPESVRRVSI